MEGGKTPGGFEVGLFLYIAGSWFDLVIKHLLHDCMRVEPFAYMQFIVWRTGSQL